MSATTSSWTKLARLSGAQRRVLYQALALLPLAALGLRCIGLRRLQAAVARLPALSRRGAGGESMSAKEIARLVSVAARHGPYRAKCLATALALQSLLRRRGIEADLRLGVRKAGGRIEAHAWLEHEGIPLIESADVRELYDAFDRPIDHRLARSR